MIDTSIEPAKQEDYNDVVELFLELHDSQVECNPKSFRKLDNTERLNWFPKEVFEYCLNPQNNRFIDVCKHEGKIVGMIDYLISEDPPFSGNNTWKGIYIGNFIVKREYRRQGIGTKLINYIREVKCPENNLTEIGLDMDAQNISAKNFYKKIGMVEARIKFSMSL